MSVSLHNGYRAALLDFTERKGSGVRFSKSEVERFWAKVDKSGECWLWTASRIGGKNGAGGQYGQFAIAHPDRTPGKQLHLYAHRVVWILTHGSIPAGLEVCHRCDVPHCCNPSHLFLGTHTDNVRDASRKGRLRVARPRRQKITAAQLSEIDALLAADVSQREVARRFGVSEGWVSLYRRGERRQYGRAS